MKMIRYFIVFTIDDQQNDPYHDNTEIAFQEIKNIKDVRNLEKVILDKAMEKEIDIHYQIRKGDIITVLSYKDMDNE
ncbi:MAG: hypothetical protein WDK96_01545 [Candidatus Paceibacterota bacterium]|jgi:hypothetical protein